MSWSRRRYLCGTATGLSLVLPGCTGHTDFKFWDRSMMLFLGNQTPSKHTFRVTISRADTTIHTETRTVPAGGDERVIDAFEVPTYGEAYAITLEVDDATEYTDSVTIDDKDDELTIYFKGASIYVNAGYAA